MSTFYILFALLGYYLLSPFFDISQKSYYFYANDEESLSIFFAKKVD